MLKIYSGVSSRLVIYLNTYYPRAYFTGPIAAIKLVSCYIYDPVSLFDKVLKGFYSELSDSKINLSIGILNAFRAASCYSFWGYPTRMKPFISSNLPLWLTWGIIYLRERSYNGGVLGLSSSFFYFFFGFFGATFFYSCASSTLPYY